MPQGENRRQRRRHVAKQRAFDARYSVLFTSILLLVVLLPYLAPMQRLITPVFFLALMFGVLVTIRVEKTRFRIAISLGLVAFAFHFLALFLVREGGAEPVALMVIALTLYTAFLGASIRAMLERIFTEKQVTMEVIKGGVAVYFLLGILWAFVYEIIYALDPNAIMESGAHEQFTDIFYFSFVTMTTLGYGDILPVSKTARVAAILESTFGPLYLAIFVARLVGLYSSQAPENDPESDA